MFDDLTKEDIRKMQEEIDYRKTEVRTKALEDLKTARAQGDLSENFEYYAAKRFKNRNESRIRYLEKMVATAKVIEDTSSEDEVGINNTVTVEYQDDKSTQTLKIVTTVRADSLEGYITPESPVGKALMGHKVGDTVHIRVNDRIEYDLKIIGLEKTDDADDEINSY